MGKAIILVVEDEPIQRMALMELIGDAGFQAIEAQDADAAIAILESRKDIRIVFTDIDMPGSMDGLKLAAAVRNRWPPIEIIVTTAGRKPGLELLPQRSLFLAKPLQADEVISALRRLAA